jgi:hypothetical protein
VEEEKGSRAGRTPCNSNSPPKVVTFSELKNRLGIEYDVWLLGEHSVSHFNSKCFQSPW